MKDDYGREPLEGQVLMVDTHDKCKWVSPTATWSARPKRALIDPEGDLLGGEN